MISNKGRPFRMSLFYPRLSNCSPKPSNWHNLAILNATEPGVANPACCVKMKGAAEGVPMEFESVKIEKPDEINFILGQSHFIKTVEDIHEALVTTVPGIKFGLAFCEASGACLMRSSGTDDAMMDLAAEERHEHRRGAQLHPLLGRGILPHQRAERHQEPCRKCAASSAPPPTRSRCIVPTTAAGAASWASLTATSPRDLRPRVMLPGVRTF